MVVYLTSADNHDARSAITNQNGDFRFTNVPSGAYTLKPGDFGKSDPAFYKIEKGALSGNTIRFTLTHVTRIGLTYSTGNTLELLMGRDRADLYRKAIRDNKGVVVPFYVFDTEKSRQKKRETLQGLLLPGGIDVDPSFYGEEPHENLEATERALDLMEFDLLEYAENQGIPIFGICRGVQVLNVFHGGALYQDIPSQVNGTPAVTHREKKQGVFHDIVINPDARLFEIMKRDTLSVDSSHHQAIKELAPGFIISALSPDGLIEGIEKEGATWVMGVQFHPEKMRRHHSEFNRIFETFMAEANKNREPAALPSASEYSPRRRFIERGESS